MQRPLRPSLQLLALGAVLTASSAARAENLYEIAKTEPKVAVGATAMASLTIKAKGGWHVNAEAPITVALTAPSGVTLQKVKLTRADLAASTVDSARFDIPVAAKEMGKQTIAAETRFVICQEQACKPVKETIAVAVEVTAAGAEKPTKKKAAN
jgi:hypothetical protein